MKPRWPHLRNGSKKDSVKRKSTELGVRGLGADAGSTVQVIVPDTAYPPGLSVVVSDAEMMIPTLLTWAGVEVTVEVAVTHVGGVCSHTLFGQYHNL